jgi:hypothetical protein
VPDYVARIWLDTAFAGEQSFKGRSMTVTSEQQVPMATLMKDQPKEVLLAKDGPGQAVLPPRAALRAGRPGDEGGVAGLLGVRTYEPLAQGGDRPDPESVRRMPDGTYEIKAGALVRVNLTLVAKDRANFVVVDDPLPAGFEGQNASFATTLQDVAGGVTSQRSTAAAAMTSWATLERGWWWWWRPWWSFSHTELRTTACCCSPIICRPASTRTATRRGRRRSASFSCRRSTRRRCTRPEQFGHGASSKVRVIE